MDTQDKLWNDLSEEKKEKYSKDYKEAMEDCGESALIERRKLLADIFGSHNLNPIKTWDDVKEYYKDKDIPTDYGVIFGCGLGEGIADKMIATAKISKIIELGYGGVVSKEEWEDDKIRKYVVKWCAPDKHPYNDWETRRKCFIAFHTPEQRDEFMSWASNMKLVEQYYMS